MHSPLRGKTAVVTGAARRIGRAISTALGAEGVNVVIHDHRSLHGECQDLCDELERAGVGSWIVSADFEKPRDYKSFIERSLKAAGNLDILVNNAAVFEEDTIKDADFGSLVRHMQINAWAPLVLIRDFARLAGRGKVINLLDTRVTGYDWMHVSYILSKHALYLLTKMTAIEFAPRVVVNAVAPGLILPPPGSDVKYLRDLAKAVPLKKHGSPRDIVDTVLFLLKSGFITGQVVHVDGGRHLMESA
jgi:pteridine reductase